MLDFDFDLLIFVLTISTYRYCTLKRHACHALLYDFEQTKLLQLSSLSFNYVTHVNETNVTILLENKIIIHCFIDWLTGKQRYSLYSYFTIKAGELHFFG